MSFIVHACDISNPVQKFEEFRDWGLRIQQEFVDLYDAEKDLQVLFGDEKIGGANGISAPLPFLKYFDYQGFAKGQVSFTRTFVLPTWESLA